MKRRKFLSLVGGAAAWPVAVGAQSPEKATVGFLSSTPSSVMGHRLSVFMKRLGELGWVEGRNLRIEFRSSQERGRQLADLAAELVALNVNVLVTSASEPAAAAKRATMVIPIVFALAPDPLGNGFVSSLAHPGSNLTGLSIQTTDLAGKRVELMREFVPTCSRLGVLADVRSPANVLEVDEIRATCKRLGIEVAAFRLKSASEIGEAFDSLSGHADALYACASPLVFSSRTRINTLAQNAGLPVVHGNREYVEEGGLFSYGPNIQVHFRRAAEYVDKILRGAKPAEIPVEQPTGFELIINLKTAKALGLAVLPTLLARADEVIE